MFRFACPLVVACLAGTALAQPVVVTTPTTINATDTTILGVPLATAQITVRGTVLTMNGRHTIASLVIERAGFAPGSLTHSANASFDYSGAGTDVVRGLQLTVTGNVQVQGSAGGLPCSIDVTGRGYPERLGPGSTSYAGGGSGAGGSHAGTGGDGSGIRGFGSTSAFDAPTDFGSGSTGNCCTAGVAGGGRIQLFANGSMTIDGNVLADGIGTSTGAAGGGAGGSVWLRASTITGAGSVFARGGDAIAGWGAGGGGRIRLDATGLPIAPTLASDARGGNNGALQAGAGSVARSATIGPAQVVTELVFDNFATSETKHSELSGAITFGGTLFVRGGAIVGPPAGDDTLHITAARGVRVLANSAISADARGFAERTGPGTSSYLGGGAGAGGGHAGAGGNSNNVAGGGTYGSITSPTTMGSGGSGNCCSSAGAGGGVVRITSLGDFVLDGRVGANGQGVSAGSVGGGGAGGSVFISVNPSSASTFSIASNARLEAKGGSSAGDWGGGGGGRIALFTPSSVLGTIMNVADASGGSDSLGARQGGAGTVYVDTNDAAPGVLFVDNKSPSPEGAWTEMTGFVSLPNAGLVVQNGARVGPKAGDASLRLSVGGPALIASTGELSASKRGFASKQGPGSVPHAGGGAGGGAGHAGAGADGSSAPGGDTYGSFLAPVTMGSGGGGNCCAAGGAGGGVVHLASQVSIAINGLVAADGESGAQGNGGGGAGGSIVLSAPTLTGSGTISADGGDGFDTTTWGAGGGGRIALLANTVSGFSATIRAYGGSGRGGCAGAGTVWLSVGGVGTLSVFNNPSCGASESTEMTGTTIVPGNLVLGSNAVLGPKHEDATLQLSVEGNATIGTSATLGADARGFPSKQGPGTVAFAGGGAGGGASHGGAGSDGSNSIGGETYGSFLSPSTMGSGGGGNCCARGGSGGGTLRLSVAGNLVNQGRIAANAEGAFAGNGGGGAGGSLNILVGGALSGSGTIEARGGDGFDGSWGAGGGGRVSVVTGASSNTFPLANFHLAGGSVGRGAGGAGTLWIRQGPGLGTLVIDNDGTLVNEGTELAGDVMVPGDVLLTGGGTLSPRAGDDTLQVFMRNLSVTSTGAISADARGFASKQGPGSVPNSGGGAGGGGGHGGRGGNGASNVGGVPYGDASNPTTMGSGGGGSCCAAGGAGGGLARLFATGSVVVDGRISADGESGVPGNGGGGAGGGVLLKAGTGLSGSGIIRAAGGNGFDASWGGGGGGRIAIFSCNITLPIANISTPEGAGGSGAQPGTIDFGSGSIAIAQQPASITVAQGETVVLSVSASSSLGSVTYQWRRSGLAVLEGDFGNRASGAQTSTLTLSNVDCFVEGDFDCIITDSCGAFPSSVAQVRSDNDYNDIDYNNDGLFPDDNDLTDFLNVLAGGACSTDPVPGCDSIDFNNDGLFPDDNDLIVFLRILAGGEC
jgi:hypothetical protein